MTNRQPTVLMIDDDADLVEAITLRIRKELGFRTLSARNALTALAKLALRPDLVICDVKMPTANGLDICELMDRDTKYVSIPVIVLSGCSDGQTLRRVTGISAYYINKGPNVWRQLRPAIEELIVDASRPKVESGGEIRDLCGGAFAL